MFDLNPLHITNLPNLDVPSGNHHLFALKRKPSDLLRYREWTRQTTATYGSISNFICRERLHWTPLPSSVPENGLVFACTSTIPFGNQNDYKILLNDWPYGLTPDITHLVVWLKHTLLVDNQTGMLEAGAKKRTEDFVHTTFVDRLARNGHGKDRVLWFKNWTAIQSVRSLEHIHVLIRDTPEDLLQEWTDGRLAWWGSGCYDSQKLLWARLNCLCGSIHCRTSVLGRCQ